MSLFIQTLLTVIALLAALGVGWAWRGRRLGIVELTDQQIRELVEERKIGLPSSDADSRRAKKAADKKSADKKSGSNSMVEQLLEANEQLHQDLARAEARIRALVLQNAESRNTAGKNAEETATSDGNASVDESDESNPQLQRPEGEQRAHKRRHLMRDVQIAPYSGESLPKPEDFTTVKGYDISEAGISFFLSTPPASDKYVVILGTDLHPIYVKARVMRVAQKHAYLVGCRFMGRFQQVASEPNNREQIACN